jgi:PAS domain-containing protein
LFSLAIVEMPRIKPPIANLMEGTLLSIASSVASDPSSIEHNFGACERSPVGVYCTTFDGSIHYANEALVKLMGYSSKDEFLALNVARDLYDDVNERQLWQDEIEQAGLLRNVVAAARSAHGGRVYIRDTAIAVRPYELDEWRYIGIWQRA